MVENVCQVHGDSEVASEARVTDGGYPRRRRGREDLRDEVITLHMAMYEKEKGLTNELQPLNSSFQATRLRLPYDISWPNPRDLWTFPYKELEIALISWTAQNEGSDGCW